MKKSGAHENNISLCLDTDFNGVLMDHETMKQKQT